MSWRWALWSLASPSQLLFLVVLVSAVLLIRGRVKAGRIFGAVAGLGTFLLAVVPMARFLANPLETRFAQPELPEALDGIILIAGAEQPVASARYGEPQVGADGGRYISALRLAARYPSARLVYTGGPRVASASEELKSQASVAADILGAVGLHPDRVVFEERSRDTCDHPHNVRNLVHPAPGQKWVVVSSAMHIPRVVACFRAAGWHDILVLPTSYRTIPGNSHVLSLQLVQNLRIVDEATHEWMGLLYYRVTGRTQELFPAP